MLSWRNHRSRASWRLVLSALLIALLLAGCGSVAEEQTKVVLGFVPSTEAVSLADTAQPLGDMLQAQLGPEYEVEAIVSADFSGLAEAMGAGQVDAGFLHSFTYVLANERYGVEVGLKIVREGSDYYQAQFITRPDTGITRIEDLAGRTVGYVDPASTSGYLFPAVAMLGVGIDPLTDVQPHFLGSHDNVVIAVRDGDVDAGVTFDKALDRVVDEDPDIYDKVVRFALTDPIPNDTVSFRPGLDPDLRQKISDGLLAIVETEEGRELLQQIYRIDGFTVADDSDYDIVRDASRLLP